MGRCEGYYRLENRRCDRDAEHHAAAPDGEVYLLCAYHRRDADRTRVARWDGDSGIRRSRPLELRPADAREDVAA
jgi:hypothetical protein